MNIIHFTKVPAQASGDEHDQDRAFLSSLRARTKQQLRSLRARLYREDDSPHRWRTAAVERAIARRGAKS